MGTSFATTYKLLGLLLLGTLIASAVPVIGPPVNQANFFPPELRQYGIARGAMFAVFGQEMGPLELVIVLQFPIPTEMAGTSVQVTVNGETLDCLMVFTSAGQLAAILPSDTPLGDGTITVTFNGETSDPAPILVVDNAVGIFTLRQDGGGPGVYTDANFAVNTIVNAFAPDTLAIAWVTGLGARTPDNMPVVQGLKSQLDLEVSVGGLPAKVIYAGPSGCCAAVDQIIFEVPQGREGCFVPVGIRVDDSVSNFASMSISSEGTTCSDPHGFSAEQIEQMRDQGTLTVASVVISKFFPTFSQVPSPQVQALSGGGTAQEGDVFDFDGGGVNQARFDVVRYTFENYGRAGDPIAVNTCSFDWFVGDVPTLGKRLEATGQLVIDFDGDRITDLTLSANTGFTATFDSPGLDRVPGWGVAPGNVSFEDYDFPDIEFASDHPLPEEGVFSWSWGASNAEEVARSSDRGYQGEGWDILSNTAFKVNRPSAGLSRDMLFQHAGDYQAVSLKLERQFNQSWQCNSSFLLSDEELELVLDRYLFPHFPETGQSSIGSTFLRTTELETPKIPVADPNSPVDYFLPLEDSVLIREYFEGFGADLTGDFPGTGSQSQGACNILSGIGRIDIACSHNVQDATAFTFNIEKETDVSDEFFRLLLNDMDQSTFSTSIRESDDVDISAAQLGLREERTILKIHSDASPDGEIGARVFQVPLGDLKF